jgi:hypothetical protein
LTTELNGLLFTAYCSLILTASRGFAFYVFGVAAVAVGDGISQA